MAIIQGTVSSATIGDSSAAQSGKTQPKSGYFSGLTEWYNENSSDVNQVGIGFAQAGASAYQGYNLASSSMAINTQAAAIVTGKPLK